MSCEYHECYFSPEDDVVSWRPDGEQRRYGVYLGTNNKGLVLVWAYGETVPLPPSSVTHERL